MVICKECGQEISEEQYRNFYGRCPACNRLEKSIHDKKNSEASINFALFGIFGSLAFITLIFALLFEPFFLIATGFCAFISIGNYFVEKMNQRKAQEWKKKYERQKSRSETENSSENINEQQNIEFNHASDRKIKWIKFLTGTMKYIMVLPITAAIIAPMMIYLMPIAWAGIYIVLLLTGSTFYVQLNLCDIFGSLIILGVIIFFLGLILTLGGFWQIVQYRRYNKSSFVQSHFYKYIRHPQSVGLILCILGMVTMMFGFTEIVGIWGLFFVFYFFLRIEAFIEEYFLIQKYKDDYLTYVQNSGFFFPIIRKNRVPQNLWTPNPKKHLFKSLLRNFLSMLLVLSLIFIGCRLYIHFTSATLPEINITWETVFNFDRTGVFYPDMHFINEIIAVSPLFIFWWYFFKFFLKNREIKGTHILRLFLLLIGALLLWGVLISI